MPGISPFATHASRMRSIASESALAVLAGVVDEAARGRSPSASDRSDGPM